MELCLCPPDECKTDIIYHFKSLCLIFTNCEQDLGASCFVVTFLVFFSNMRAPEGTVSHYANQLVAVIVAHIFWLQCVLAFTMKKYRDQK